MKKKLCIVLLIVFAVVSLVTGCVKTDIGKDSQTVTGETGQSTAQQETKTNEPESIVTEAGALPIVKDKVTLKVFMPQHPNVTDLNTNKLTKFLEEKTNVHVEWMVGPEKDTLQKVNLILASNTDVPDIFLGCAMNDGILVKFGSQGLIKPLNELLDKYGINFKEIIASPDKEFIKKVITSADGNIYSLPQLSESYVNKWQNKLWVNETWLKELNLSIPETTDDLYNVLAAFRDNDPNRNNKKDEIPLVGSNKPATNLVDPYIISAFIYNDGVNRFIINNGKVDTAFDKPEFKEGLKYMYKLASEGLLDPVSFTQDDKQLKQLVEYKDAAIVGMATTGHINTLCNPTGERKKEYIAVPPLKGPEGVRYSIRTVSEITNGQFVITSACKYPEVAIRWADYMYTAEVSIWNRWGEPGVDWVEPEPGEIGANGLQATIKPILVWGEVQNAHWCCRAPNYFRDIWQLGQVIPPDDPYVIQMINVREARKYEGLEPKEYMMPLNMLPEENDEYAEMQMNINNFVNAYIARFVTGDLDIEKEWDNYLKELEKMGLKKYIEMTQNAYSRQYLK